MKMSFPSGDSSRGDKKNAMEKGIAWIEMKYFANESKRLEKQD